MWCYRILLRSGLLWAACWAVLIAQAQPSWPPNTPVEVVYSVTVLELGAGDHAGQVLVRWTDYPDAPPPYVPASHIRTFTGRPFEIGTDAEVVYGATLIEVGTGDQAGQVLVRWHDDPAAGAVYVPTSAVRAPTLALDAPVPGSPPSSDDQAPEGSTSGSLWGLVRDWAKATLDDAIGHAEGDAPPSSAGDDDDAPSDPEDAGPAAEPGYTVEGETNGGYPIEPVPAEDPGLDPIPAPGLLDAAAILERGVMQDLAGRYQLGRLAARLAALSPDEAATLHTLLTQAHQEIEQVFLLKALAAGDPLAYAASYAEAIRGLPEDEIVRRSTMRDASDLIQQWHDACAPSLVQTALGEANPRYAWELNAYFQLDAVDPNGGNAGLAAQQKEWLEAYGGLAVPRNQTGGRGIPLMELINAILGPVVGATYRGVEIADLVQSLEVVAERVHAGYDVPLRILWAHEPIGPAATSHFVLVLGVDGAPGRRRLQIHDTWSGKTAWVDTDLLFQDRLYPFWDGYARITHYYDPSY